MSNLEKVTNEPVKDCVPCQLAVGLGMMIDICHNHKFTNIDCDGIKNEVVAGKKTFEAAFNELLTKARETPASWDDFDKVIKELEKVGIVK